jgi:ubiquinone/menaquinone biosynthesis C-methylase UbiE
MVKGTYKDIAPYYDRLMDDVNYEAWVDYVKNICILNRLKPKTVLDLGCGTGIPTLHLFKEGYRVIGLDGSMEMLRVAKEKLASFNPVLILGRFENFTLKKKIDLVISLFDSLNNLIEEGSLQETFMCVERSLTRGGIFVFDMNTVYGLSLMNSSTVYTKESNGVYSIWKSQFDRKKSLATLNVTLFVSENGHYRRIEETHKEKGYSLYTLKKLLRKSGFSKISLYEHLTFRRASSKTKRVMVVARKD